MWTKTPSGQRFEQSRDAPAQRGRAPKPRTQPDLARNLRPFCHPARLNHALLYCFFYGKLALVIGNQISYQDSYLGRTIQVLNAEGETHLMCLDGPDKGMIYA